MRMMSRPFSRVKKKFDKKRKKKLIPKTKRYLPKVDYKDTQTLSKYLTEKGKILPRKITRLETSDQRRLTWAIKRAREVALLPYQQD